MPVNITQPGSATQFSAVAFGFPDTIVEVNSVFTVLSVGWRGKDAFRGKILFPQE